ncbi:MAG: CotH kinase family protein [Thermoflexales bacterium]|nr:CotH kinase family protein [Thermoflexales bacterium]
MLRRLFKTWIASSYGYGRVIVIALLALLVLYAASSPVSPSPTSASAPLETVFSLPGGYYDRDIRLELGASDARARVIFTVDGRLPTHTVGITYTQPIRLSAATPAVTVIRARAVLPGGEAGPVRSASYFVGLPASLPVMSLVVDPPDLWDAERGLYVNAEERGAAWERPVDVSFVDQDRQTGFHIPAGIRIHGHWSRTFDKRSFRLYFRREYGASRLEYPLFPASELGSFKRLVLHGGGEDWHVFDQTNWTLVRNALTARLAFQLGSHAAHSRPVLLFINGEPWGIYQLREHLDGTFLADHYQIESADFLKAPEFYTGGQILMGSRDAWDQLVRFVETHELAEPASYAYVQTQLDLQNFIDYTLLEMYTANIDWPEDNVYQFRPRVQAGRWRWIVWDDDRGWGMYLHGSVSTNIVKRAVGCGSAEAGGRDTLLLRKLLENPVFRERFLVRMADLLNTTLSPPSVIAHIDLLAAELKPDMAYESLRWASLTDWESNVQQLRDFARRRPDYVRRHAIECFGLDGLQQLALASPAEGQGYVAVNDVVLEELPWQGVYFQGLPLRLSAVPSAGYRFAGWEPPSLPQTPVITATAGAGPAIAPRFEALPAAQPRAGDVVFSAWAVDDEGQIEGDWFELEVKRPGGVDLRGWRVTDNDTKAATDEGSLIFAGHPALARVPQGMLVRVIATRTAANDARFARDDLGGWDRRMVLYVANGNLDGETDPWFELGANDNLVLLAPGATSAFEDDRGIAFIGGNEAVTPASFGVLVDGIMPVRVYNQAMPAGRE